MGDEPGGGLSEQDGMLGGRYRMESPLGQGGMAQVFRGTDTVLGRQVAIKILAPQYAKDPSFVERFRREAQSAARLNHPNVVGVYDTGSDDGTHYIVMEFVEGRTLADFLSSGGSLLPERAVELASSVCVALSEAHKAGIVHRDIKPGNIMVTRGGEVKVMDFGIARAATAETVTATATVLGTASYLSPEQAQGKPVDARSDIYSLGVVLYEMLTGRVPFGGDSAVAVAYKHVQEPPEPPSRSNPDVSPSLEAVVMRALAKNPDNRYQTAEEFCADLDRVRRGMPVAATPLLAETQAVAAPVTATRVQHPTGVLPPEEERSRWPWILIGLLVLLGVLIALFLIGRNLLNENANKVAVPKLTGRTLADAEAKLKQVNLKAEVKKQIDTTVRPDTVLSQSPTPGTTVSEQSVVHLVVARAEPTVPVPDVTNQTLADATSTLQDAGFTLGRTTKQSSDTILDGRVISQDPAGADEAAKGSAVDLVISTGQELVSVPDLTCQPVGQAQAHLQDVGLTLAQSGNTQFVSDCPHAGRVASQSPAAGTQVEPGSTVTVEGTEDQNPTSPPSP
jgi:beta-lactam-binding protein with PASTA domain/tRNA A-37 threonylcarbamoyl transferase component Bud32